MNKRLKDYLGEEIYNILVDKGVKVKEIDVIPNNYVPKNRFDDVNEESKTMKDKISNYEKQINDTKDMLKGHDELKKNYDNLNTKYNDDRVNYDKEISNLKKVTKAREVLLGEGAVNGKSLDMLVKSVDFEKISMENDKLIGFSDVVKDLKKDCKHMFVEKQDSGKPPKDTSNNDTGDNNSDLGIFQNLVDNKYGW